MRVLINILGCLLKKENLNAEDFIQKSLKAQIELHSKQGLRANLRLHREEQLMDDKRIDYTIFSGFIGQILLELKLYSILEAENVKKGQESMLVKLQKYIKGSHSDYGIFYLLILKFTRSI